MLKAVIYQNVEVFCVVTNSDLTEGRGARVEVGWFKHRTDAEHCAVGKGVFGSAADVEPHNVDIVIPINDEGLEDWLNVKITGKPVVFSYNPSDQIRERALAKLSKDERRALGL